MSMGGVPNLHSEQLEFEFERDCAYWEFRLESIGLAHVTRTPLEYEDLAAVTHGYEWLLRQFRGLVRPKLAQLIDLRNSPPGRNDAGFEQVTQRYRPLLFGFFCASALVVRTATGRMQVTRMKRQGQGSLHICSEFGEARTFLLQALGGRSERASQG